MGPQGLPGILIFLFEEIESHPSLIHFVSYEQSRHSNP
jgi:hypothetical protein